MTRLGTGAPIAIAQVRANLGAGFLRKERAHVRRTGFASGAFFPRPLGTNANQEQLISRAEAAGATYVQREHFESGPLDGMDGLLPSAGPCLVLCSALRPPSGGKVGGQLEQVGQLPENPIRVISPGQNIAAFSTITTVENVAAKYRSDPRFTQLSCDPAHNGKQTATALREAMSGLEAELQAQMEPPITRGPAEIDFYDAQGRPYDVKTPRSPEAEAKWTFNPRQVARSVIKQLDRDHENPRTKRREPVRVILDVSYLSRADHAKMWKHLNAQLDREALRRIIEINVEV